MADFNPDQYLSEKTGSSQGFDPDAYLQQKTGSAPVAQGFDQNHPTIARYRDSMINAMPAAGAMIGGIAGAPEGGVGAIPGAALGGMAGKAAQNVAKGVRDQGLSYFTGKPTVSGTMQSTKDLGTAGIEGAGQEMGGQLIGKGLSALKTGASTSKDAIMAAAERLGITPTGGMVSDSMGARGLESSLSQSPSLAGMAVRSEVDPVKKGLQNAAEDVLGSGSDESAYEAGGNATKNLIGSLGEKYNNVQQAYEPFNSELPKMVPSLESKALLADQVAGAGKGNLSLSSDVEGFGNKVANKVIDSNSLGDIEELRKQVSQSLNTAYRNGDYNAIDGISKIEDHLNNFRDSQFEKLASESGPTTGGEGTKMGQTMVGQYKEAQGTYKDLMGQIKDVAPSLGIRAQNPKGFIDALNNIPEEKLATTLANPKYVKSAQVIQENFPDTFEQIKNYQIGQIADKSVVNGEIDPAKLVRETKKLSPEFKKMIFGDKASKLSDMETIINSFPSKMGPSGTPQGELFNQSWNPGLQATEGMRYGQYKTLTNPTVQGLLTPNNIQTAGKTGGLLMRRSYDRAKNALTGGQ